MIKRKFTVESCYFGSKTITIMHKFNRFSWQGVALLRTPTIEIYIGKTEGSYGTPVGKFLKPICRLGPIKLLIFLWVLSRISRYIFRGTTPYVAAIFIAQSNGI